MKSCIVIGFGRSGTSLMGGLLYHSGYFLGNDLYPPRESNPKGFFENAVINGINERILAKYDFIRIHDIGDRSIQEHSPYNPEYGQRWLSYIEPDITIENSDQGIDLEIQKVLSCNNYAYKDPRFNFTLPVWKKYFKKDTVFICVFRQPGITVESVLKDCKTADYLKKFNIDGELALKLWNNSYQRVLKNMVNVPEENIIFVHYEQILSREILPLLSAKLEVAVDSQFISLELNRSRSTDTIPDYIEDTYKHLCDLSGFQSKTL